MRESDELTLPKENLRSVSPGSWVSSQRAVKPSGVDTFAAEKHKESRGSRTTILGKQRNILYSHSSRSCACDVRTHSIFSLFIGRKITNSTTPIRRMRIPSISTASHRRSHHPIHRNVYRHRKSYRHKPPPLPFQRSRHTLRFLCHLSDRVLTVLVRR